MTARSRLARSTASMSLLFVIWHVPPLRESPVNLVLIGSCFALIAKSLRQPALPA